MYAAQKEIAKRVGARHDFDVSVYAATETEPLAAAVENSKEQPEETPGIEEGDKVTRKSKPSIEEVTKPKLAAFVAVAEKLEHVPVEMKGDKDLKDYAGMNPQAAAVMGWPDKDKAIEIDKHQPEETQIKDVVHEVVETEEMKQGENYHDSHVEALDAEKTVKTPEQLEQKVAEIRGETTEQPSVSATEVKAIAAGSPDILYAAERQRLRQTKVAKPSVKAGTKKDGKEDVTTEGQHSKRLRMPGRAAAARSPHHTAEIESSNLSPATIAAENKVLKEVKRVFERAAAKDMPVRIATGHWDKDADGTWKYVRDVNTPQVHSSKANPSVKRENLYLTVIKGTRQLPQPKGTPKPHMDMKRQGKVINIKGVGLARNIPKGRVSRRRGS